MDPEGRRGGTTRGNLRTALPPTLNITTPGGTQNLVERQWVTKDPNLEEPPELGPEVTCFLRKSAKNSEEEEEKVPSPKPPVKELHKWVTWKAEACKMPSWWKELMAIPEVEDWEKLPQEVQASFQLPKRASELHKMENYHQALPALPCLLRRNFLPPPNFHLCLLRYPRDAMERRWWHMPRLSSIGQRKLTCLLEGTTPVGGECKRAAGGDEVLPLLLRWGGA